MSVTGCFSGRTEDRGKLGRGAFLLREGLIVVELMIWLREEAFYASMALLTWWLLLLWSKPATDSAVPCFGVS